MNGRRRIRPIAFHVDGLRLGGLPGVGAARLLDLHGNARVALRSHAGLPPGGVGGIIRLGALLAKSRRGA